MFDKKTMKVIKFNKSADYMMKGQQVFMVKLDGSMVEVNEQTDMEILFRHNMMGGIFAVYRKKNNGTFAKSIKLGRWTFSINHEQKGVDDNVLITRTVVPRTERR